ncbi:uncharacterized protein LOC128501418 [Spea bombifrons]|uniref:uncharacterized protein LOC128501418 n=1 Tax=Spea bombifrons TaxID=233779 RepID=UPI00234BF5A5|nr:uncharacterized protein LOC128501418 [Spea bombifrons]
MALSVGSCALLLCTLWSGSYVPGGCSVPGRVFPDVVLRCPFEEKELSVDVGNVRVRWDRENRTLVEVSDGRIVVSDPRVSMSMDELGKGKAPVTLSNLTVTDSGTYNCTVQYAGLRVLFQYMVEVKENKIKVHHIKSRSRKQFVLSPAFSEERPGGGTGSMGGPRPPVIAASLGSNVTLPCHVNLAPSVHLGGVTIRWTKDGHALKAFLNATCCGNQYSQIDESDLRRQMAPLRLVNVTPEDSGTYNCYIKHESEETSSNVTLEVKAPTRTGFLRSRTWTEEHRVLKIAMVAGVTVSGACLAAILYFCYAA